MSKTQQLQDPFLNAVRKAKANVAVYLVNGIKLTGTIDSFDNFVLLLKSQSGTQLVYKHAVSTIVPQGSITLHQGDKENVD